MVVAAITAPAMGGAHRATAIGFVSAFSRLPVHPANTKANSRAMILIRAIPFCWVSKQERRREWNAIIGIDGWKYDPRENRESARSRLRFGRNGPAPWGRSEGRSVPRRKFGHESTCRLRGAMSAIRGNAENICS